MLTSSTPQALPISSRRVVERRRSRAGRRNRRAAAAGSRRRRVSSGVRRSRISVQHAVDQEGRGGAVALDPVERVAHVELGLDHVGAAGDEAGEQVRVAAGAGEEGGERLVDAVAVEAPDAGPPGGRRRPSRAWVSATAFGLPVVPEVKIQSASSSGSSAAGSGTRERGGQRARRAGGRGSAARSPPRAARASPSEPRSAPSRSANARRRRRSPPARRSRARTASSRAT